MNRTLLTHLVLPLIVVFSIAIAIHLNWKADGFFLNLATELLGILITICYVEWILRRRESQKWRPADNRIENRLRILLNSIISSIRDGLGYGPEILNENVMRSLEFIKCHKEVIRVGEHVIAPTIHQRIRLLDTDGWKSLARQVVHAHNGTIVFLTAFQNRLSPEQISHLLDIEEGFSSSLIPYSTFPELMGVPTDQLPKTTSPPGELQQFVCQSAANQLQKVLLIAKQLSATMDNNN